MLCCSFEAVAGTFGIEAAAEFEWIWQISNRKIAINSCAKAESDFGREELEESGKHGTTEVHSTAGDSDFIKLLLTRALGSSVQDFHVKARTVLCSLLGLVGSAH